MAQITYSDKVATTSNPLPDINKVTDANMNEIKSVVNDNSIPINTFSESLLFDEDEETFASGGVRSFTLQITGNVNGVGKVIRLNTPTSAAFSGDFILIEGSNADIDATKLNIIVMRFFLDYDGVGTKKVLYRIIHQTAI